MDDRATLASALSGRYEVLREVGAGGMATVYLAQDIRHDRRVAIKVLHPELSAVLGADRFLAEIKLTAALQHPHILPLFDSGSADGLLFYVMPYVEGETLRTRLSREKQLPIGEAVSLAKQVAGALDYAHRHGVIHRDIKPENVLLHDGSALVADFGIALAVQTAGGQRMTQTGLSLGTPAYMSPEQAMGERDLTARSDVYALGAISYEMLVGEPPFSGPTAQAIVAKVITDEPRPLHPQRKSIPANVEAAVLTALQKLPADRFGTAAEYAAALNALDTKPRMAAPAAHRARAMTVSFVAGALAIGLAIGALLRGGATSSSLHFAQKTVAEYQIFESRFAPDGKTLVYSAGEVTTPPSVYVIRPDYPEPQPLNIGSAELLAVSSQSELAVLVRPVYLAQRLFRGTLARVPIGGGAPRELVDSVTEADWSPDGLQLAIIRMVGDKDRLEYPEGKVLAESAGGYLSEPRFSPDGKYIAFAEHPFRYDNRGTVDVVDMNGKKTTLTPDFPGIDGIAWSRDGREVLFSARANTRQNVVQGVTLGKKLHVAIDGPGDLLIHDVASDGRWLVGRETHRVQTYFRAPGANADRSAGWFDYNFRPLLSRDGTLLAFGDGSAEGGDYYGVVMRRTDGGPATRLGEGEPTDFSSDGKWLLSAVASRPPKVVAYPTGAGSERVIDAGALESVDRAWWGPNDESVIMCGNEKGKAPGCFLRTLKKDGPLQPLRSAFLSPDGTRIVVTLMGQGGVGIATLTGDGARPIPGLSDKETVLRWSPDGRALWTFESAASKVWATDVATGRRQLLLTLGEPNGDNEFTALRLADDPKEYAYSRASHRSVLFVVEGAR